MHIKIFDVSQYTYAWQKFVPNYAILVNKSRKTHLNSLDYETRQEHKYMSGIQQISIKEMNQTFANTNDRAFAYITNFVTKYCSSSQILHFSHIRMWGGTLGLAYLPRSISEIWELARNCLWLPCVFHLSGRKAISTLEILTSRGRNENMVIYMSLSLVRIKCHRSRNDIYGMILCCHHHCDTKSWDCSCLYYHGCEKCMRNKANLGDLIAATGVVILLILD